MQQNLDLFREVLRDGTWQSNRTGIRTISIPGASIKFDLSKGFPAVTTKKLAFKSVIGELVGFLRSSESAAEFRALGCKVWDQNANENAQWLANPYRDGLDDIGPVYGVQWRKWPAFKLIDKSLPGAEDQIADAMTRGYVQVTVAEDMTDDFKVSRVLLHKSIDQLRECLDIITTDPTSRRILFHGWNPAVLDEVALPACHLLKQFICNPETREISMVTFQRSVDLGLGLSFNQASDAAMLHLVGRLTGYTPKWLTMHLGDTHIYENHMSMVHEQLSRTPFASPQLVISDRVPKFAETGKYEPEWLDKIEPSDFSLQGYEHHAAISAPMAV